MYPYPHRHRKHEKQSRLPYRFHGFDFGIAETDYYTQENDPDNVVDYRGRKDNGPGFGFEFTEFFQRFNGYGHAGGGHHHPHENVLQDFQRVYPFEASVEGGSNEKSSSERQHNPRHSHKSGGKPVLLEFFQIRFHPCRKHYQNNSEFGYYLQRFRRIDPA